jgi:hypothetical protein
MSMLWWKCKHGAPFDPKWRTIARRVSGRPGDVWSVASALFDAASQAEPRGNISKVDLEEIADGLGYEIDYVTRIHQELRDKDVHDGQLVLNFEKHQSYEDTTAAERKRRQRQREKELHERDGHSKSQEVTASHANVTLGTVTDRDMTVTQCDDGVTVTDGHASVTPAEEDTDQNRSDQTRPESESPRAQTDLGWVPGQAVPDDWKTEAANARVGAQLPPCDLNVEAPRFSAYYAARDHSKITNWRQAFIAFVLRADASAAVQAPKQPPKPVERDRSWEMHPKTEAIIAAVGQAEFDTWLAKCRIEEVSQAVLIHAPTALVRDRVWNLVAKLEPLFAGMHVGVMCLADPNVVPLAAASSERMEIPDFLRRKTERAATA